MHPEKDIMKNVTFEQRPEDDNPSKEDIMKDISSEERPEDSEDLNKPSPIPSTEVLDLSSDGKLFIREMAPTDERKFLWKTIFYN